MKKQTGIWIDGTKAVIVTLVDGKERIDEIESEIENRVHHFGDGDAGSFMGSRHINNDKKFDERKKNQFDHYLDTVLEKVKGTDELYVFGPAGTRTMLQKKVDANEFQALSGKLLAVEPSDSLTSNQIVARVKKYFGRD